MSKVLVQIVSKDPVRYSLDNGVTLSEFAPKQVYEVPDYVGRGMVKRKWAKQVTAADLETADLPTDIDLGTMHEAAQGDEEEVEEDGGEEESKPHHKRRTKVTRKKR